MASIPELIAQIRFQLDQLGARNAHHEFEHLCRYLARRRICSNILPATGPVAGGGDQGRDFESFRTYLASGPLAASAFVGLVSERPLAFACSLQRQIEPKIRADVETIFGSGEPVEGIHYFCAVSLPVARRHGLKSWARERYDVQLEVYDAEAISELLTAPDVFWIATRFLDVPSELYPKPRAQLEDPWYELTAAAWHGDSTPLPTFAAFAELKSATRYAIESPDHRQDLPFWLSKLETFVSGDVLPPLRYRAIYEIAVASLRGLATLEGLEERLRSYFGGVATPGFAAELEDASVLVTACLGAACQHAIAVPLEEIQGWHDSLVVEVDRRLTEETDPGRKCELLVVRGYLELTRETTAPTERVPAAVSLWAEAAELAGQAPLFPLQRFSDRMAEFIPVIGDDPGYEALVQRIDGLMADRFGEFVAARNALQRAHTFHDRGQVLRAISELHEARIRWFAHETLHESVLATMFISASFLELGLTFAAKYYALVAAYLSFGQDDEPVREQLPLALVLAAGCAYEQGDWRTFLPLAELSLKTHSQFALEPGNVEAHGEIGRLWARVGTVLAVTEHVDAGLFRTLRDRASRWAQAEWIDQVVAAAPAAWGVREATELRSTVEEQLRGPLFGDLSRVRDEIWEELGIVWKVRWTNDRETNRAAEQFVAVLQIGLTDFAKHDLHLLRTEVDVEASIGGVTLPTIKAVPSNRGRQWQVTLPREVAESGEATRERSGHILGAACAILNEVSLLLQGQFQAIVEEVARTGIVRKTLVTRSYEQLYEVFLPHDSSLPDLVAPDSLRTRRAVPRPAPHPELAWIDDLGATYSEAESTAAIRTRYARIPARMAHTLARLRESDDFRELVRTLRADGWKDWHILLAVANQTTNHRLPKMRALAGPLDLSDPAWRQILTRAEGPESPPVPVSEYSEEKLRLALRVSMLDTLAIFGLELHQDFPDFPAIEEFLARRYRYWDDDVEHEDPFG